MDFACLVAARRRARAGQDAEIDDSDLRHILTPIPDEIISIS
jgi:hypothetical protein